MRNSRIRKHWKALGLAVVSAAALSAFYVNGVAQQQSAANPRASPQGKPDIAPPNQQKTRRVSFTASFFSSPFPAWFLGTSIRKSISKIPRTTLKPSSAA